MAPPSQILLFSQPRTACHMLVRTLSFQPDVKYLMHPYVKARPLQVQYLADESVAKGIPEDLRKPYVDQVNLATQAWEAALEEAKEKGEILFMHEHPHFALIPDRAVELYNKTPGDKPRNFTLIPDSLLLHPGTVPIMTTRHPALTAPAGMAAMMNMENSGTRCNLMVALTLWQRELYDWYVVNGITPLVVEAEDYMSDEEVIRSLAKKAGLKPEKCVFKWEKTGEDQQKGMHPMYILLQQTLLNSEGLVKSKSIKKVDLDEEIVKWREQFGPDNAEWMAEKVRESMPDYEFLRSKKIVV